MTTGKAFLCLIFLATLPAQARISEPMVTEICDSIIPFARQNGAAVSENDFYHCHVLLRLKDGEARTSSNNDSWEYLEERRHAYLCHAHEKDMKRRNDNFNIFVFNGQVSFWGAGHPVVEEDLLERLRLPKENFLVSWTNLYFFPSTSKFCPLLTESVARTCGGTPVCVGLESDAYDREQAYPSDQPFDPDLKPWEQ